MPESQPTPASIGLSQAQHWKKNLFDLTCEHYSNLTYSVHN